MMVDFSPIRNTIKLCMQQQCWRTLKDEKQLQRRQERGHQKKGLLTCLTMILVIFFFSIKYGKKWTNQVERISFTIFFSAPVMYMIVVAHKNRRVQNWILIIYFIRFLPLFFWFFFFVHVFFLSNQQLKIQPSESVALHCIALPH